MTPVVFKISSKQGNPFFELSAPPPPQPQQNQQMKMEQLEPMWPTQPHPAEVSGPRSVENSWASWSLNAFCPDGRGGWRGL